MNKKKYIGIGIGLVLLILIGYLWLGRSSTPTSNTTSPKEISQNRCFNNHCFHMEIADTAEERTQGLMYREKLAGKAGMVFVFPDSEIHAFRMKNTKIPLDMIRLDASYKIVDIKQAMPCTQDPCDIYTPKAKASYVIELNQGIAKSLVMKPGDTFSRQEN